MLSALAMSYIPTEDTSAQLGLFWQKKLDTVVPRGPDGKVSRTKRGDYDPPFPQGPELAESFGIVMQEDAEDQKVPESTRQPWDGVKDAIKGEYRDVKRAFDLRKETSQPCEPNARGSIKPAHHFDDSKILKTEAELAKRFNEKVSAPNRDAIRDSRVKEMRLGYVTEFCRGNELFDKKDYEDSLSEYALASEVGSLRLFALINRGNALKALGLAEEAIAIYQDVLDEAGLDTVDGRLVHSFAYNNLGAACQDAGRLEQSLQHLQSAVSLNKNCYLAIRNRANVHMHLATNLQKTAQPSLLPPQHETALGLYAKAMENDWHLPIVFQAGEPDGPRVLVRVEARVTSHREEPAAKVLRNTVYHFTSNITHVTSTYV